MRVAVIGLGATGASALRFLARTGHRAVGYEQFEPGHDRGSSHGESRIIRYTYPDDLYTALMTEAYPLWRALEEDAGRELLVRTGGLYFAPAGHPELEATEAALRKSRVLYERLDPDAVRDRFPAFRLRPGEEAVYQAESGFLRAGEVVRATVQAARAAGAEVRSGSPVREVRPGPAGVEVVDAEGAERFDRAVVAAGPWIAGLVPGLRRSLTVTRQEIAYVEIRAEPRLHQPDALPVWIDAANLWYGFPADGRVPGIKLARHVPGPVQDPDGDRPPVELEALAELRAVAEERLPHCGGRIVHASTCLYTSTPDEDFVLDLLPDDPRVAVVSGCSGHGFKFTVLLGKLAAEAAIEGKVRPDLSRFRLSRFAAP